MSLDRDMELMYEIGCIRNISRVWKQMHGKGFANLAEHHFRVAWISLLLAKMENLKDTDKVLKMALVHDVAESRTGDVHYISRLYTQRNENEAFKDIFKDTSLSEDMQKIWDEYEQRESLESKIVKDADTIDVDLELHEQAALGNSLEKVWQQARKEQVYPTLFTDSAKKIWESIAKSDIHQWHMNGPNRLNSGDWKK